MSKLYAFNRRLVDDQAIFVRADSLAEAWRKARGEDLDDTGDTRTVKVTLRRTPNQDTDNG
jgi:hypothetical protein